MATVVGPRAVRQIELMSAALLQHRNLIGGTLAIAIILITFIRTIAGWSLGA